MAAKMLDEMDESVIPKGMYCYDENGTCPYWGLDKNHDKQENGYCSYMGKGDWDINKEWTVFKVRQEDGSEKEVYASGEELGIQVGLLWDKCKECNIKMLDEREVRDEA